MYHTIIFDLDDTLTDDKENIREAFKIVMKYREENYNEEKFERFYTIDKRTWKERAEGKLLTPYEDNIEKKAEWLRAYRFIQYYDKQISYEEAVHINNIYMEGMKQKVIARKGVLEVIQYLHKKGYRLIIATNGPIVPLQMKIKKLGITDFIDVIFSAEEVGYMKPHQEFYKGVFEKAHLKTPKGILIIGDELEKDVKGAIENNLDICWCNYNGQINNQYQINYEIHDLKELMEIL